MAVKVKIPWAKPDLGAREKKFLAQALDSTWISGGPYVERFESEFLKLNKASRGLTTSNGTTALEVAYLALGIQPGDEVIVPGFTFAAPANMVLALKAVPVFADIDARTWCVDPRSVERLITNRTKAIVCVHVYGNVCAMDALLQIARSRGIPLIEDTAQAMFSKYKGKNAGTFGDIGCFSFQATKTITTGEGGFVLTERPDLHDKMRVLRDHGMRPGKRYWHEVVGYNFRLTNLQAAVGCAQLERLPKFIAQRKNMLKLYREHLKNLPGVELQYFEPGVDPAVWAIGVRLDPKAFSSGRDAVIESMRAVGIETRPGFYPFSVMPLYKSAPLPVTEDVGLNVVSLPSFPSLKESEVALICRELKKLRR